MILEYTHAAQLCLPEHLHLRSMVLQFNGLVTARTQPYAGKRKILINGLAIPPASLELPVHTQQPSLKECCGVGCFDHTCVDISDFIPLLIHI